MKKKILMLAMAFAIILPAAFLLSACGEKIDKKYTITLPASTNYTVECDKEKASAGQEVTLTVTLSNKELVLEEVLANDTICKKNSNGTFSFTMPAENVEVKIQTNQIQEVFSTNFVWLDEDNLYTITMSGQGTLNGDTRDIDITFVDKQAMTIVNSTISSSNQNVIPNDAIKFNAVKQSDLVGSGGSNQIVKGVIEIDPFKITSGTTYLTMKFVNGNNSMGSSNRGTLVVKITVVPYGELTLKTVKETLTIELSREYQYNTGDKFCLRIGDRDYVDGSSNLSYVDYVLTMESGRKLTVEFDYILGHKYWIRLVEGTTQPDIQSGYIEEFIFDDGIVEGDEDGVYTGYYNSSLMYLNENDSVTIDAKRNPALKK